jgi:hypothetical protein
MGDGEIRFSSLEAWGWRGPAYSQDFLLFWLGLDADLLSDLTNLAL